MKIVFVAVFDRENRSTNNSQARGFHAAGAELTLYSFRDRASTLGDYHRDNELLGIIRAADPDLVVFSKCAEISVSTIGKICAEYTTCYWYMDPLSSLTQDLFDKASLCSYVATAVPNTQPALQEANQNTFLLYEGFDHLIDCPKDVEKKFDATFIGSLHSERRAMFTDITPGIGHITNAYGSSHAEAVSMSRINLNVATSGGASDRVFKVMAAGGFLMSTDWAGRHDLFVDKEHIVIFSDRDDLQRKIAYYLAHPEERNVIANNALNEVQKYNRNAWALEIIRLYEEVTNVADV